MPHATNEQMALVMGWHFHQGYWVNTNNAIYRTYSNWRPTHDLNHVALVEARLYQLGLVVEYMEHLLLLSGIDLDAYYEADAQTIYSIATASAQTRCDAAWAAYSAWKESHNGE